MGQTLNIAAEKKGYTLTDRATYLAFKKGLGLEILVERDGKLLNIYHVIELNSAKWPGFRPENAEMMFRKFVRGNTSKNSINVRGSDLVPDETGTTVF